MDCTGGSIPALKSVIDNYAVLQELWDISQDQMQVSDPSIRGRIIGVEAQFKTFRYLFGVALGELVLKHTDNLSKTLQSPKLSAAEGQHIATMTVATLQSLRSDTDFDIFWTKVEGIRESLDVDEPTLPRNSKRKVPKRYDDGASEGDHPRNCKDFYRKEYYEALDLIINSIKSRFDQPGYRAYRNLQDLLIKAVKRENYDDCFSFVCSFYGDDINPDQLRLHLDILSTNFSLIPDEVSSSITIFDVKDYIFSLSPQERDLMSEVITILKLVLVMPSTNAISERSFSALRRVKTYLRSTMTQERLNSLLTLHVHKEYTDSINLLKVANYFVSDSEHRHTQLGKFSQTDMIQHRSRVTSQIHASYTRVLPVPHATRLTITTPIEMGSQVFRTCRKLL